MKDTDTRSDTFWQYSWDCKEESSVMMNLDGAATVGTVEPSNLAVHDDMTSWLHLDDPNCCAQVFGDVNRAFSSVQIFKDTRLQQEFSSGPAEMQKQQRMPTNADAALALAAGRAAGFFPQTGVEAFHRSRTVCNPTTSTTSKPSVSDARNVSHTAWLQRPPLSTKCADVLSATATTVSVPQFSASAARTRCNLESSPVTMDGAKNWKPQTRAISLESDRSTLDCRSPRAQSFRSDTTDFSRGNSEMNYSYDTRVSGQETSSKKTDTFTSSTGGSRSDRTGKDHKRKEKDVEDTAGCHRFDDSSDRRKPPRASKRSRAAEVHNLSERKRRDRINERMKALQELIPNSNKTDKASMLDEAIEYLKMLQHQLQMMSMRSGMMSPITAIPHMQMPPVSAAYNGIGMGVRLVDVSGHQSLLPPHPGISLNVAVPVSMSANGFLQGMSPEIYNSQMINQQQQQVHDPYINQPHSHKQEDDEES